MLSKIFWHEFFTEKYFPTDAAYKTEKGKIKSKMKNYLLSIKKKSQFYFIMYGLYECLMIVTDKYGCII